ncbi:MAG: response regulator transcription factor [Anaerolineales bacterium]|nr:response regulator transcription factor [Anaerolineales bacterium]WKZ41651.1 MAG: response regulator transcription factor [Anaerolineales bacterium]
MNKKVLVIDDDPELGQLIDAILKPLGLTAYLSYSGMDGLKKAYAIHPDLIILDINMPDLNGFEVCSRLREFSNVPILMLTARFHENDMLHSFHVGVDDFLGKPFNKSELQARIRALLRRSSSNQNTNGNSYITAYIDPVLDIDLSTRTIKLLGKIVELSPKEYDLLACLVREQGKILSHHELAREVWGDVYANDPSETSLYIYYLRKKLKDGQHGHRYIRTHWGRGYWFASRSEEEEIT